VPPDSCKVLLNSKGTISPWARNGSTALFTRSVAIALVLALAAPLSACGIRRTPPTQGTTMSRATPRTFTRRYSPIGDAILAGGWKGSRRDVSFDSMSPRNLQDTSVQANRFFTASATGRSHREPGAYIIGGGLSRGRQVRAKPNAPPGGNGRHGGGYPGGRDHRSDERVSGDGPALRPTD